MNAISRSFRVFSLVAVCSTFALIAIGGIVRTTGSGLGCPDWPLCYGQAVPPYDVHALIEFSHRLATTLVSASVVALALWASARYRHEKAIFWGSLAALVLLGVQIGLGAFVVVYELPAPLVGLHLGNALLILAALVVVGANAFRPWAGVATRDDPALVRLSLLSVLAVFAVILSGTVVTGTRSTAACLGWPLCNGEFAPRTMFQATNLAHRYLVAAAGVVLIYLLGRTLRAHRANRPLRRAAHTAAGLYGVQILAGGLNVLGQFHPALGALHVALSAAVWSGIVLFAVIAAKVLTPLPTPHPSAQQPASVYQRIG